MRVVDEVRGALALLYLASLSSVGMFDIRFRPGGGKRGTFGSRSGQLSLSSLVRQYTILIRDATAFSVGISAAVAVGWRCCISTSRLLMIA